MVQSTIMSVLHCGDFLYSRATAPENTLMQFICVFHTGYKCHHCELYKMAGSY